MEESLLYALLEDGDDDAKEPVVCRDGILHLDEGRDVHRYCLDALRSVDEDIMAKTQKSSRRQFFALFMMIWFLGSDRCRYIGSMCGYCLRPGPILSDKMARMLKKSTTDDICSRLL